MTTSVRYVGTAQQYSEIAVTGKQRQWTPGKQQDVTDSEASALVAAGNFAVASPLRARTAAQLAGTPSASDIAIDGEFYLYTDPSQRYVINAARTAYVTFGGGGPFTLTAATDYAANLTAPLAGKVGVPQNWNGTTPALASSTSPLAFGTNAFIYNGSTSAVLDGLTFNPTDMALWNGTVFTKVILGGGYIGSFASTTALQAASPAASNAACTALVVGVFYVSNGTAWAMTDGATLSASIAANTTNIANNTAALSVQTDNAQAGTTYTFALGDAGQNVDLSNASAITATIPPHSAVAYPIGTLLYWTQAGAGLVTIAPGAAVAFTKPAARSLTTSALLEGGYAYQVSFDNWRVYNG